MSKFAFKKIAAGLEDAIAYAGGDTSRARVAGGPDVKAIRAKTKLSQTKFAETFDIPVSTIRDWEQDRRAPEGPARTLLSLIEADPPAVMQIMRKVRVGSENVEGKVLHGAVALVARKNNLSGIKRAISVATTAAIEQPPAKTIAKSK
ncbi:helix-turn-helix domain-containing protein [Sphingomonas sp. IC081]|uniref:helix-turn-helix domain-containing protein n=1 Tax=Sphingomonas sp. IC081 TaxID=304378 RepID=UPI0011595656|nr:helix-turn-helix domain-containing protein [Sphingomonas sp. IC081]QDK32696.1 hypothetical protein DM450_07845 [Sphingomonas sp. IC081]